MGVASFVISLICVIFSWVPVIGLFLIIPALIAFILGIVGTCIKNKDGKTSGLAVSGLVFSLLYGVIVSICTIVYSIGLLDIATKFVYDEYFEINNTFYSLGDKIDIGKTEYVITKFEKLKSVDGVEAKPGYEFIAVNVSIKNNGSFNTIYTPYLF